LNEREIISLFSHSAGVDKTGLVKGIGDDCAALQIDRDRLWLVTMDTLVESIHFNTDWHPPDKLGRKSLAVNVSDIAAMGGSPLYVFLSLGLPQNFNPGWLEKFSRGLAEACLEYDCCLAGGDTVRSSEGIVITLTVIGEVAADQILYRNSARPGDEVWVSGTLGNAAAGLELCREGRKGGDNMSFFIESHLNPRPRLKLARRLAASGFVHAMMDLSDGLATDLAHLCEQSGVGAVIYSDLLPVKESLASTAKEMGKDFLQWVLSGGEDYELVFTAPDKHASDIATLAEKVGFLTKIGHIDEGGGVRLVKGPPGKQNIPQVDISFMGYDHFKS